MATDVDVQYFSHLNGLTLGSNWGDLIRLLDKALVTGVDFTQITAASIDAQGDVHITLYAAHNAMLFQVVELSGFTPASLNQKYRIKGVPSATELILKPHAAIVETNITTVGAGKLASLGYEIIFRDTNDVKRVYRAKNPTAQHPFIRVDESLTSPDGTTGVYTSTYAKYAMVGLLEHMEHIDDYENPDVLQLPFDQTDPSKNWKIVGTGAACVRGWSRWYWARSKDAYNSSAETETPENGNRYFSLIGDKNAFYFLNSLVAAAYGFDRKMIYGLGRYNATIEYAFPHWFLATSKHSLPASTSMDFSVKSIPFEGSLPFTYGDRFSKFAVTKQKGLLSLASSIAATPIMIDYESGASNKFLGTDVPALEIPFFDSDNVLRGSVPHLYYSGKLLNDNQATPILASASMYIADSVMVVDGAKGSFYFYLGELE
ncbi:hypothetical protein [Acinetobacter sp. YH12120]|uniref:hypothetical protein n=1 Tax=Acinetobacter sp. YH12120 TaxID=2601107 RepID=UPI0015D26E37|nr:hypothetical protein [Acinetobacter sp. YH12120]